MPSVAVADLHNHINLPQPPSPWLELDQDRINLFADATLDHQYIHVDVEKARQSPFGGTVAHGFLSLSVLSYLSAAGAGVVVEGAKMGVNYGFDKVRFIAPVAAGKRIRGHFKLLQASEKNPGQQLLKSEVTVEIEGEAKPALVAQWLTLFYL